MRGGPASYLPVMSTPLHALRRALAPVLPERLRGDRPVVPVVRLQGAIGVGGPLRPALTLAGVAPQIERAFSTPGAREVAIIVNSPGGSPVQAHLIHRRIRQLAAEKDLGVTVFVEDAAASGGYMIACAGDEIVADPSSIVGSIGVVSAGFGFDRAIERLGVDRRLHASGANKAILDPFSPEKPEDVERLKDIQREVHEHFIALVKERRGEALDHTDGELFSGAFWTASTGLGLGLVDRIGDLRSTLRERWGDKVDIRLIATRQPLLKRLSGRGDGVGAEIAGEALAALESRALWSRLGL